MRLPIRDPERIAAQDTGEHDNLQKDTLPEAGEAKTETERMVVPENSETPENKAGKADIDDNIVDDGGNNINEGDSLPPNKTFVLNGIEYRTDDNGKIYCIDCENNSNDTFELNGHIFDTDDVGHVYRADCEFIANDSFILDGNGYHTDSSGELFADEKADTPCGVSAIEAPTTKETPEKMARTPDSHGHWDGDRGNSKWHPDPNYIPPGKKKDTDRPYNNPDQLSWREICDKCGIDGIPFKEGFPDFSEVARGTVQIDGFETGKSDAKDRNFDRAYLAMAEQRGCKPEEVKQWMDKNNYTWHECEDKKTMQKVPHEVHANVPHDGGRSQHI